MHAVILQTFYPYLLKFSKKYSGIQNASFKGLDIGTGYGYIPFGLKILINQLWDKNHTNNLNLHGIDIFDDLISGSNKIRNSLIEQKILE